MAFVGMSPEAIRQVATGLSNNAESLNSVITTVESAIQEAEANWKGLDSTNFVNDWSGQHKVTLQTATDAISQLSQSANQQADQQETTSNA
ncbi:WXG100 family type VII secretion target [Nocardioides cavernaquae]|jgi:WXG100 family type VII secretion target|uniref:WXG100 family type VII secretion target n=1 Tax=Nocardioides cavernaquae TaxID=2321396 RepID=A0A3A5H3M6_9ACTN|nr:WXG100 family type VII secretion target [Nocardioides cavernaquae]RJS45369.1 hypothetical protein D4739_03475 [Nocardioides cavernaquae]